MNTYNSILKILRKKIIKISYLSQSAHLGSSLSCLEIIFACFQYNLKKKTEIILSKGHAALAYNVVLEYFSLIKNSERFISNNSNLWGHITRKNKNEYLKFGFGSLGYGLGISAGLAYSNRKKQVLCILSDGELNEGSFWESLLFIHHYKLKNLVILIDNNKIQSFGYCKDIINLGNLKSLFSKYLSILVSFSLNISKPITSMIATITTIIANVNIGASGIYLWKLFIPTTYVIPSRITANGIVVPVGSCKIEMMTNPTRNITSR